MSTITLRQALGVLTRSSPFSEYTVSQRAKDVDDKLKVYIYAEQGIKRNVNKLLMTVRSNETFFLCDNRSYGKSEILFSTCDTYRHKCGIRPTLPIALSLSNLGSEELFDLAYDECSDLVLDFCRHAG